MLARLLSECQSISSSIEKLVNAVREKKVQEEGRGGREGRREGGKEGGSEGGRREEGKEGGRE